MLITQKQVQYRDKSKSSDMIAWLAEGAAENLIIKSINKTVSKIAQRKFQEELKPR